VLVEEHRRADVAAVQLWVRAGGRDEQPSELGLAHYLEHLLFKGTPARPAGFVDREVESTGGRMNAGTSLDYTYYHMLVPAWRAQAAIETLADVSVNASLEEGELEREKAVVLEEMRLGEDTPMRFLTRQLYAAAFPGHPYGRPVIGDATVVQALRRDQLLDFYRRHYVPEAFTVVVVGALDPHEAMAAAVRAFGPLPRGGAERLPVPPVRDLVPRRVERTRPGSHAYLGLAWHAPPLDHPDTPAVDLLVAVLGQGRGSRLVRVLRERQALVQGIAASYAALEAAGLVSVTAQCEPDALERVESEIWRIVDQVRDEGISRAELERARTAAEARRAFQAETAEGRAFTLGHAETVWRLDAERAYLSRLRGVTPAEVQAAARRYLSRERAARVLLAPGPSS
jgi:zinc protease